MLCILKVEYQLVVPAMKFVAVLNHLKNYNNW